MKLSKHMRKYYFQRYRLFSKYDEGIELDDESWYSVTPGKEKQRLSILHAMSGFCRLIHALTGQWKDFFLFPY